MKPVLYIIGVVSIAVLASLAGAEVSQEDTGLICEKYLSEGESVSVSGPLTCDGFFWTCDIDYYGKRVPVLIAVDQFNGQVVDIASSRDLLEDIVRTKYALDFGAQSIFSLPVTDSSFVIQMRGLNATFQNYDQIVTALKDNKAIEPRTYIDLSNMIEEGIDAVALLIDDLTELNNYSTSVQKDPDCYMMRNFIEGLEDIGPKLGNFTQLWTDLINEYNQMASTVSGDYVVPQIDPSGAQLFAQKVGGIGSTVEAYLEEEDDYVEKVLGNVGTRERRKGAKDVLDMALVRVTGTENPEATQKYNAAVVAFNNGNYAETERLAREAMSLADIIPDENGEPIIIIEEAPDYTVFFIAIGALITLLIAVVALKRKGGEETEEGEEEGVEAETKEGALKKGKPRKSWGWTKD